MKVPGKKCTHCVSIPIKSEQLHLTHFNFPRFFFLRQFFWSQKKSQIVELAENFKQKKIEKKKKFPKKKKLKKKFPKKMKKKFPKKIEKNSRKMAYIFGVKILTMKNVKISIFAPEVSTKKFQF